MSLSVLLISFLTFVQLNCENFFDCKDDPQTDDSEYLPTSPRRWTTWRYWQKQDNIAREIISCGEDSSGTSLPHLIALCEIENDSVLHDLTKRSMLRNAGYEYLITHSADRRGIDVALLYDPLAFAPINQRNIRVAMPDEEYITRDILYVAGRLVNDDTLHVFVVHAPSRWGSKRSSTPRRQAVAEALTTATDSIRHTSPNARIIISGDFNDTDKDPSIKHIITHSFVNVTRSAKGRYGAKGTYKYRGRWQKIDHILVSEAMKGDIIASEIHDEPFLLTEDAQYGGVKPRRTYTGYTYNSEGYSDHLPLVIRFKQYTKTP